MTLQVELVSPERILYSGEAESVLCRTVGGGDIAFYGGHSPFVGALDVGVVVVRTPEGAADETVAVHGGFVEVSSSAGSGDEGPATTVTILSDVAELRSQIDVDRAQAAKERAEAALRDGDDAEVRAALKRAEVRLSVAEAGTAVTH
ncbi:MAG TPA: ATP synthase F1 subunit epsilon [Acidimicrobiales bacterium]|nr:ATP synthase F1 subunit epsilon [Acidimicrobiales bacterium]